MNEFNPDWRSAPGESIADIMVERGKPFPYCLPSLAKGLDLTVTQVHELLDGTMLIDEPLAVKLSSFLGSTKEFWLERERRYRIPL